MGIAFLIRFVLLLCILTVACSAKRGGRKKPWKSVEKFEIEILSKNETSIQARFRPLIRVKKYIVNVMVKNLADAGAEYSAKLKKKRDRNKDGYFYVDTGNVLYPGTLYEFAVHRLNQYRFIKHADVFTDCDDYTHYCVTSYRESCLDSFQLCDGNQDCVDGSDEEKVGETCAITLPERPTPPPPPPDTPCMKNLTAAKARARSNGVELSNIKLPSCGADGHYESMDCDSDSTTCYCVHPLTGEILQTQTDFHPFVHWDFADICEKKSKQKLANHRGSGGEEVAPEVEPPPSPEILPPFTEIDGPPPLPEVLNPLEFPFLINISSLPQIPELLAFPEQP